MSNGEAVVACIAVVLAGAIALAVLIRMWITTSILGVIRDRIDEIESGASKDRKEWADFKEANGIDESGQAHPWKISVFHSPRRKTG